MDENLFCTGIKCCHSKQLKSLNVEWVTHKTHHILPIHKVLWIAISVFFWKDNDIEKEGRVLKIKKTKKYSYKRIYTFDGSYTNPKGPENRLWVKGNFYFRNMEISGSKNGTEIYSNYFFFLCHHIFFPYLELMVRRLVHEGSNDIIVYYQMDETGSR